MKAISVQQPHACALAAGWKPVENRGRTTHHRGPIAIHSGLTVSDYNLPDPASEQAFQRLGGVAGLWRARPGDTSPAGHPLLALGAVIAIAHLVDVHPAQTTGSRDVCCAPWGQRLHGAAGRPAHHLMLTDVIALPRPVPCPGTQIVAWELPVTVTARINTALAEFDPMTAHPHTDPSATLLAFPAGKVRPAVNGSRR